MAEEPLTDAGGRPPGNRLAALARWAARAALTDEPRAYRRALGVVTVFFAAAAVLCIGAGPLIQVRFGHDTPLFFDGAWKIYWGYRPHVDFYNPFADLEYLLVALCFRLTGPNALALPLANALAALGAAALAWAAGRRRLSPALLAVFVLCTGCVALSSHLLRFPFWETGNTCLYNRHGYALLMTLSILLLVPERDPAARRDGFDGALAGAILALLPFIKITYFLAGGALLAGRCLLRRPTRRWLVGLLVGGAVTGLPYLAYLGFDLRAYARDLAIASTARRGTVSWTDPLAYLWSAHDQWWTLLVMAALGLLAARLAGRRGPGGRGVLVALGFVLCTTFIMSTNAPDGTLLEVPLFGAAAVMLMEFAGRTLRRGAAEGGSAQGPLHLAVCLLGLWLVADLTGRDVASIVYGSYQGVVRGPAYGPRSRFQGPGLSDMAFLGFAGELPMPVSYAEKVNDGLALLDRCATPRSRVEVFDFTNPFPFAALRPPNGAPTAWQLGFTFSRTRYPAVEQVLGEADLVLVPTYPASREATGALLDLYGPYLEAHFELRATSAHWTLLGRKRPGG